MLIDKVEIISASPSFADVKYKEGRESAVPGSYAMPNCYGEWNAIPHVKVPTALSDPEGCPVASVPTAVSDPEGCPVASVPTAVSDPEKLKQKTNK